MGFIHTRGWIFGYKLHIVSSTSSLIVPLAADVTTTANMPDNQVYPDLTSSSTSTLKPLDLSSQIIKKVQFMVEYPGYDDQGLYQLSIKMGFQIVCPVVDTGTRQKND